MEDDAARAGQRVRALRNERGWTQRELERRTVAVHRPVSHSTISQLERGKTKRISLDVLGALALTLGVPVTALLPAEGRSFSTGSGAESPGKEAVEDVGNASQVGMRRSITPSAQRELAGMPGGAPFRWVPVYRYGTVGDPTSLSGAPVPTERFVLKEELVYGRDGSGGDVGEHGWGVVLVGNELNGWQMTNGGRLLEGTAVFCNPEAAKDIPREAWIGQLVIAADLGGRLIAGVLEGRDAAGGEKDDDTWIVTSAILGARHQLRQRVRHVYGNVVWYQHQGSPSATPVAVSEWRGTDEPPSSMRGRTG